METIKEQQAAPQPQEPKKKVSKTWEAIMRLKGSVTVNDPLLLL